MGVRYGLLFGGHYTYLDVDVACGGVPLIIPVFWVIFIYISHCMLNTFLLFLGKKKPARESGGLPGLLLVIALDGALVVIIDVIMDPIMVKAGKWQWADGGTYHGVPLGNFFGWFVLACLASGSFRAFEYLRPRPEPQFAKQFHLVPAVGYATALFGFIIYAVTIDLLAIIPVALLLMGPVLAANLVLYAVYPSGVSNSRRSRSARTAGRRGSQSASTRPTSIRSRRWVRSLSRKAVSLMRTRASSARTLNWSVCSHSVTSGLGRGSAGRTLSLAKTMWTASRGLASGPSRKTSIPATCR
jgi:uncharacterized membrane protein